MSVTPNTKSMVSLMLIGVWAPTAALHAQSGEQPDPAAVVALLQAQDGVILRIGERLVVSGKPFCADSGQSAGMTVQMLAQYGAAYRVAAAKAGVGERPTITAVVPGSASATAGLKPGDQILRIDGHSFSPIVPRRSGGDFAPTAAALTVIEGALTDGSVELEVQRAGQTLPVLLKPRPACQARFDVRAGRASNASSDGVQIQISSDLVTEARDDEELAAILAHELAHNILRHPQRLKRPPPRPGVKQTEIEADRLSVYLLDAAGYTIAGAERFWGRWGKARDLGIFAAGTHPGWKQRIATFRTEAARIADLKRAGQPITAPPELTPPR